MPKAENLLKTKGRKMDFSTPKAENMLKGNPFTNNQVNTENSMTNWPAEVTPNSRCGQGILAAWGAAPPKDVKNADRPGYMYENKGTNDKMTDAKDDIFTQSARILQKLTAFFRYLRAGNEFFRVKMWIPDGSEVGHTGRRRIGQVRQPNPNVTHYPVSVIGSVR